MVARNSEWENKNLESHSEPIYITAGRTCGCILGWESVRHYIWERDVCSQCNYSLKVPGWVDLSSGRARF